MRVADSWYLCFRLFKREFVFYFLVLLTGLILVGTLMSATELYRSGVTKNLASKQPHFTLTQLQHSDVQAGRYRESVSDIKKLEGVVTATPFARHLSWGQFSATTTHFDSVSPLMDKFSSGYFTVIGVDKTSPSIVSWENINFYTAGPYKTKITNLEFEYDWVTNPELVVPNAVFDSSFYPPISQEARIKTVSSDVVWQVKGFIQDHFDEARIYVDINLFGEWLNNNPVSETGLYVRMQEGYPLDRLRSSLEQWCQQRGDNCFVTAWLDRHDKKRRVLNVFETFSWGTSVTIFVLVSLLVALYQAKSVISKSKTINILYVTGYSLNRTVASIVLTITLMVYLCFFTILSFVFPYISSGLASETDVSLAVLVTTFGFCVISSLFSMGVFYYAINRV